MKILILSIIGAAMLGTAAGYLAVDIAQDNVSKFGVAPRVLTVRQGGTGQSSFGSSTLLYGNNTGALQGTSSPVVTSIIASSTSATSSFEGGGIIGKGFQLKNYTTCNLDTDANGFIQCGTDAGGGAQTPWTSDINADGYDLTNLNTITATSSLTISGGLLLGGNQFSSSTYNSTGSFLMNSSTSTITNLTLVNATSTVATTTAQHISGSLVVAVASSTITNLQNINATSTVFEIRSGGLFGLNGEYFNDFTGTGLTISGNALQSTLGTSVNLTSEVDGILPLLNGGTNNSIFAGNTVIGFDGTRLVATSTPSFTALYATSTTATSTFAGNFEVLGEATTTNLAVIGNWAIRHASTTDTSGSITVDWDLGSSQQFFITGTTDFVINATSSHPKDGGNYKLRICNTGANTVTFSTPGNLRWWNGTTSIPTTNRQCAWLGMIYEAIHGNSSNIYTVVASSTPISY